MERKSIWLDNSSLELHSGAVGVAVEVATRNLRYCVVFERVGGEREITYRCVTAIWLNEKPMPKPMFNQRFEEFLVQIGWRVPTCALLECHYPRMFNANEMMTVATLDRECASALQMPEMRQLIREQIERNAQIHDQVNDVANNFPTS